MSHSVHVHAFRDLLDGSGVVEDPERIATYTTDQRQLFTGSTFVVLKPATTEQVAGIVRVAARLGIGIVPQGGNTSYCGGATPDATGHQTIVSLERMDMIREILDLDGLIEAVLAEAIESGWIEDAYLAQSGPQRAGMWEVREMIPEGEKRLNGSVKHDISVPLSAIQRFLDVAGKQVRAYGPDLALSVYGHVGDGNLHYNILVPPHADRIEFTKQIEGSLSLQLYDTAAALDGTFSAEHGVGRFKKHLLEKYADAGRIAAMRRIKAAFDPWDIMNPGAVVRPSEPASDR